jgi:hypothetical protein
VLNDTDIHTFPSREINNQGSKTGADRRTGFLFIRHRELQKYPGIIYLLRAVQHTPKLYRERSILWLVSF